MKKTIFCIILLIALILQPITLFASEQTNTESDYFTIYLVSDDPDINLSDVEIYIYSSELINSEDDAILSYDENYAFSVFTDDLGEASFQKPSDCFSITIQVDTLPIDHGIDSVTRFFDEYSHEYYGFVKKIDSVGIGYENGNINAVLLDKDGKEIYADTSILSGASYVNEEFAHNMRLTTSYPCSHRNTTIENLACNYI